MRQQPNDRKERVQGYINSILIFACEEVLIKGNNSSSEVKVKERELKIIPLQKVFQLINARGIRSGLPPSVLNEAD